MRALPWPPPATRGRDLALAGVSLAGGLIMHGIGFRADLGWRPAVPVGWFLVPLAAVCVAVALRRVATRTGLALGTVALLGDLVLGGSVATSIIYTQVLYDSCVYGSVRLWRRLLGVTVGLTVAVPLAGVVLLRDWRALGLGVLVALVGLLPVLTGTSVRQYRDQAAVERERATAERERATAEQGRAIAERQRAEQTARLAELDRRQAVNAERSRMARELHDVVANHLSAVAIHATAVLSVPGLDRARVDSALRVIRENSVQGLAEMRQMIGLLREPACEAVPPADHARAPADEARAPAEEAVRARLSEVPVLVNRARAAGLTVRERVTGTARRVPVAVDLAGYRIVQESLTNALKHGGGEAELLVAYRMGSVVVTVTNPVRDGPDGLPGAGAGLIGMRERTVLLAGRFSAAAEDGQWRVRAELPTTEAT
ncbi:sensor histidine kinase [Micromonospora yangpuensis]|uniref:sensor histidine kinase n=1 Tax=Micromonospora yangpuensis TaxID=683228 RepID=UPI001C31CE31|nr:histidine kinase [Micromonospora yangpuensis]